MKVRTRGVNPEFGRLPGRPELHGAIVAAMVDISGHAAIAAKLLHSVATIDNAGGLPQAGGRYGADGHGYGD